MLLPNVSLSFERINRPTISQISAPGVVFVASWWWGEISFQNFRSLNLGLYFCVDFPSSGQLIGYVDFTDSYDIWPKCSMVINAQKCVWLFWYSKYFPFFGISKKPHTFFSYLLTLCSLFSRTCEQEGRYNYVIIKVMSSGVVKKMLGVFTAAAPFFNVVPVIVKVIP